MFERLQKKWHVSGGRLLLILVTFAVGGSLTGIIGKKIMNLLAIGSTALYIPIYIIVVTLVWPFMVLTVSLFTGQFLFFRNYLSKLGRKIFNRKTPDSGTNPKHRIAIFASGAGSNAQKIIDHFRTIPTVKIALIVCNKPEAGVVKIAEKENIPFLMIEKETFFKGNAYVPELQAAGISFIVLAGFLWKVPQALINTYRNKIINIHPALLPKYGGKGMYGAFVHEAVIQAKEKESGITIHYVDEHYDHGDAIFQARCEITEQDTAESLAQKIHRLEHEYFPKVIESLLENKF